MFFPFKLLKKKLGLTVVRVLSSFNIESEGDHITSARVYSVSLLRTLCEWDKSTQETDFIQLIFKKAYLSYSLESKRAGGGYKKEDQIKISQNALVELFKVDLEQAYQVGYNGIRMMCLELRNARN